MFFFFFFWGGGGGGVIEDTLERLLLRGYTTVYSLNRTRHTQPVPVRSGEAARARSSTVLTRCFGGDYLAEGSANCAAINLIFNFFRQHVISGSTASRKGAGEGHYARNCINIPRPMVLNLAMLNDYRTCTCTSYTMHRHTAPVVFILVLLHTRSGSAIRKISFLPAIH